MSRFSDSQVHLLPSKIYNLTNLTRGVSEATLGVTGMVHLTASVVCWSS